MLLPEGGGKFGKYTDRGAAAHAEREAAAMKPANAWVWKAGVVPVRAFYPRGPEAVEARPTFPARGRLGEVRQARLRNETQRQAWTFEFGAMVLLGASVEAILIKGAISAVWGMWIHANVDVRSGRLQWVINGPEMHRWHHAIDHPQGGSNFGTKLAIWDWIFGTAYRPGGATWSSTRSGRSSGSRADVAALKARAP